MCPLDSADCWNATEAVPKHNGWVSVDEYIWMDAAVWCWNVLAQFDNAPEAVEPLVMSAFCFYSLWVVYKVIRRWPRLTGVLAVSWLVCMAFQVFFVPDSLSDLWRRTSHALHLTKQLTHAVSDCFLGWVAVFSPLVIEVGALAWTFLQNKSTNELCMFALILGGTYAVWALYHVFMQRRRLLKRVLFQVSFLIAAPLLWFSTGYMPPEWLAFVLQHMATTVPVAGSFLVAAAAQTTPKAKDLRRSFTTFASVPENNIDFQKLWLSYWACWPAVRLLEAAVHSIPQLLPQDAMDLTAELQRVVLVFVTWLQVWQGSRVVVHKSAWLLPKLHIVQMLQAPACKVISVCKNHLVTMLPMLPWLTAMLDIAHRRIGRLQQTIAFVAFLTASLLFSIWAFHSVWKVTTSFFTVVLWWFAAVDTGNALLAEEENVYTRKLSFWVLARCWLVVTTAPYIGDLLSLFTPFIFTFFLLAGDKIINILVLPAINYLSQLYSKQD